MAGTATLGSSTTFSFGVATGSQAATGSYEILSAGTLSNSIPIPQTYSIPGTTSKQKLSVAIKFGLTFWCQTI